MHTSARAPCAAPALPRCRRSRVHAARHVGAAAPARSVRRVVRPRRLSALSPPLQPQQLLDEGKQFYALGERMAALKLFEEALRSDEQLVLPPLLRRELRYSAGCCHAAFGDIELAWMNLREAVELGLPYASWETEPGLMRMEASAQMRIQLRKYAEGKIKSSGSYAREQFNEKKRAAAAALGEGAAREEPGAKKTAAQYAFQDLEVASDTDESFVAIAKRVGLLLLVAGGGGVLLYLGGLGTLMAF